MAEDEGLEPPWPCGRRFSRPLPYQLGLVLRYRCNSLKYRLLQYCIAGYADFRQTEFHPIRHHNYHKGCTFHYIITTG